MKPLQELTTNLVVMATTAPPPKRPGYYSKQWVFETEATAHINDRYMYTLQNILL
jgi:hypothetical protein